MNLKTAVRAKLHYGIALLLAVLIGGGLILFPLRAQYGKLRGRLKAVRTKIQNTEEASRAMKNLDFALGEHKAELERLKNKTLAYGEQSKIISMVTKTTEDLGVVISNIKPLVVEQVSPSTAPAHKVVASLFGLDLETRYTALGAFFESLEKGPFILNVDRFDLEPKESDPGLLRVHLVMAAYEEAGK